MKMIMKKKNLRFLAFLLTLIMVVNSVPMPTRADVETVFGGNGQEYEYSVASSSDATPICQICYDDTCDGQHDVCENCGEYDIACGCKDNIAYSVMTPSEADKECKYCGAINCEKEHETCDVCEAVDCKKTHEYCNVCEKYDCKKEHVYCDECEEYDCGIEHEASVIGRLAKFKDTFAYIYSLSESGYDGRIVDPINALPSIVRIVGIEQRSEKVIWYKLEAAGEEVWPSLHDAYRYIDSSEMILLDSEPNKETKIEQEKLDISVIWDKVNNSKALDPVLIGFVDTDYDDLVFMEGNTGEEFYVASASNCPKYFILDTEFSDDENAPLIYKARSFDTSFEDTVLEDYSYIEAKYFEKVVAPNGLYVTVDGEEDSTITLWKKLDEATDVKTVKVSDLAGEYVVEEIRYASVYSDGWYVKLVPDENWPEEANDYYWIESSWIEELSQTSQKDDLTEEKSISTTVTDSEGNNLTDSEGNPIEVTVSGDALPEGARLEVNAVANVDAIMEELNMEGGFIWDIKVYDENAYEWQPIDTNKEVKLTFKLPELKQDMGIELLHFLDNENAITELLAKGKADVVPIDEKNQIISSCVSKSRLAWQQVSGSIDDCYVVEEIVEYCEENGTLTIMTNSFSIWAWNGSQFSKASLQNGKVVMKNKDNAPTVYASNGTSIAIYTDKDTDGHGWSTTHGQLTNTGDKDATLVISNVSVGTTITVKYDRRLAADLFVYVKVVDERKVTFNENGHGQLTNDTRYGFYIYDGTNEDFVDFPTISEEGYHFLGWSKSSDGTTGVVNPVKYKPGTADEQLYAQWTPINPMEYTDVRMAINESYWFTDFKYKVTADGVESSSYHAFPNEPAQQSIRRMRADNQTGVWKISDDNLLVGNAGNYIDASILDSEKFIHSYISTQNTYGVVDSTGVDTKAFLKFTQKDYEDIIKVWLQHMADNTTPNGNGTYSVYNRGKTYTTDVNWDAEVDKWQEYELIPYVIKMENSNAWRIDTVIAPSKYVSLTYDLNINTAAGYSLTAGSSIPNAQYERYTTKDVYLSPAAYNANTKVTKTVNGAVYTAEFLYWLDEQGNKYGTGYNTSIYMDGNKSLKAVWRYTDQTEGALHVGKDVVVPNGSALTPDTTTAFTINVELNGAYPYVKYNTKGIQTGTGTTVSGTTAFALKDSEYVIISEIPASYSYKVTETLPADYSNRSGTITGNIQAGNTVYATVVNQKSYKVTLDNQEADSGKKGTGEYYYLYKTKAEHNEADIIDKAIYYYTDSACSSPFINGSGQHKYYTIVRPEKTGYTFGGYYSSTDFNSATQYVDENGMCVNNIWDNVEANSILYAKWIPITYAISGTIDNGGAVTNYEQTVQHGNSSAEMVFTPAVGYKITEIKINDVLQTIENDASYTYPVQSNVTSNITVNVKTALRSYLVTGTIDEGGTVENASQTVSHGGNSTEIVFRAKSGYEITSLMVNGESLEIDPCTNYTYPVQTNVTGAITVSVGTTIKHFKVTGSIEYGTVTNNDQTIGYGESSQEMKFTPAEGYEIVKITVNGKEETVNDKTTYTYEAKSSVTENITVVVSAVRKSYKVTGSIDNGGQVTNGDQTVYYDQNSAEMKFTPATGYKIVGVTVNGEAQIGFDEYGYTYPAQTNVTAPISVVVTTEKAVDDLTIAITGANTGKNYIFDVRNKRGDLVTQVVLTNSKKSITVKALPVDEYTISPVRKWTWRQLFEANPAETITLDEQQMVTFNCTFDSNKTRWLNGFSYGKTEKVKGGGN